MLTLIKYIKGGIRNYSYIPLWMLIFDTISLTIIFIILELTIF